VVEITGSQEALRLEYGPGLAGPLEHWHHDTFIVHWDAAWRSEAFVTFRLDAGGEIASLEMSGAEFARRPPK